jgi:rhodanese-related sulfurtransferase
MAGRISIEEFRPLSQRGGFDMIDVRSATEFYELHAVGALLMPLEGLDPRAIMESRGERQNQPLYIICRSGGRSLQACQLFEQAGYSNVISIEGGTLAWQAAGLPINRGIRRPMSIERQIRLTSGLAVAVSSLAASFSPWLCLLPALIGFAMAWSAWTNNRSLGTVFARFPWNRNNTPQLPSGCGTCTGSCGGT